MQVVGKRDKRWHTQKPDMQGDMSTKTSVWDRGGGLWDRIWTLTPAGGQSWA